MLRLYVMRHAKSSWAVPGARDFDRELNERGISDLEKLSKKISERKFIPKKILCSSAVRTRQTLDGLSNVLSPYPEVSFTEKLYSSGLDDYLSEIQMVEDAPSLMIIGHNPMCGSLADALAGQGDEELLEKIAYKYPTGTIAVIDFDLTNWADIDLSSGTLVDCLVPSSL